MIQDGDAEIIAFLNGRRPSATILPPAKSGLLFFI
jgi:hypothetical protein